jgi:hypothetical protein
MNEIVIVDTLGNETPVKVTDETLQKYNEIGITYKFIGKSEKPEVLRTAKADKE